MRHKYTDLLDGLWNDEAAASMKDLQKAILDDTCLKCYDHRKLLVLKTDFSTKGFGYVACQPAKDAAYVAAMTTRMSGGAF